MVLQEVLGGREDIYDERERPFALLARRSHIVKLCCNSVSQIANLWFMKSKDEQNTPESSSPFF